MKAPDAEPAKEKRRTGGCLRITLIVALAIVASLVVIGFCLSLIADDEASERTQEVATPKVVERVVTRIVTVEVRVEVTPTATIAKPTESSPTVEPTLELAASIVRSGKGQSGGQIDLPAGVYQIHFWVTENDRSFARDRYELTLISRSGRNAPITIEGSDSSARESVRYDNLQDDLLFYEVDVAENGSWQIEIVQTGAALPTPTPIPATPTPTSTKEADPTSEASPTPAATPTSTPTPLREYEVQVGDTLSAIADRFGVEVSDVIAANDIADPNVVQVGAILEIPHVNGAQTDQVHSPSSTPTRECPTPEQQAYFERIASLMLRWYSSQTQMVTLATLSADNPLLLFDDKWKLSLAGALVELDNVAIDIDALDAPSGADEVHANLRRLSPRLHAISHSLAEGLDDLDPAAIERAAINLQEATRIAETLAEQRESFCE